MRVKCFIQHLHFVSNFSSVLPYLIGSLIFLAMYGQAWGQHNQEMSTLRKVADIPPAPTDEFSVRIYPNPTVDAVVHLDYRNVSDTDIRFELLNLNGEVERSLLLRKFTASRGYKIDVLGLQKGVYLVRVSNGISSDIKRMVILR